MNNCHQLRKQLEMALELRKLNHLIKDVKQRGRGNQRGEGPQQAKIINMIRSGSLKEKKRKAREVTKEWMNTPITFPPVSMKDVLDDSLIVKAKVEGYLVRRICVDGGASVEVMFEHCFENLGPAIKAKLRETQTDLENDDEVYRHQSSLTLQYNFGKDRLENVTGHPVHHAFDDEIPHSQGNSHFSHPISVPLGMQAVGK
nr:hypothetical protein [Tanacetum cinerariifolium]